jgi:hypothetical protein
MSDLVLTYSFYSLLSHFVIALKGMQYNGGKLYLLNKLLFIFLFRLPAVTNINSLIQES